MNPKKYAQQNCKNKSLGTTSAMKNKNKQNEISVTEAFYKKFSVGQHGISQQMEVPHNKKNITDQKISVCLDHSQSQNKTFAFEKSKCETDLKYLNERLESKDGNLLQLVKEQYVESQFRSQEVKRLLENLIDKCEQERNTERIELTSHILGPYLEQQMMLLQKNYSKLKTRGQELEDISNLNESQKKYITKTLMKLEEEQRLELQLLRQSK